MDTQTLRIFAMPKIPGRRAAGASLVIALHVGLVLALLYGLKVAYEPTGHIIPFEPKVFIDKPVEPTIAPPPVPPGPNVDPRVPAPEPLTFDDPLPAGPGSINVPTGPTASVGATGGPSAVMNTHTIPPYPPISIRLGEIGVVSLRVVISEDGFVTDATVVRSSGYARLDDAAVAWVKSHWRYHPAVRNGQAVASTSDAQVKFELHNLR